SRKGTVIVGGAAFAVAAAVTVVVGNPTLTARPAAPSDPEIEAVARAGIIGRVLAMGDYRVRFSALQQEFYPHYALRHLGQKVAVVIVQGYGRFSPFGPAHSNLPVLYDWSQDRWACLWLPWVAACGVVTAAAGRRQLRAGEQPTAWALLAAAAISLVC